MVGFYYVFNDSDGASIKRRICKIISAALISGAALFKKKLISNAALIRGRRSIGGGAQTSKYCNHIAMAVLSLVFH